MAQIWIVHPEGDEPALVTQEAFDILWQHKGFEPVDVDLIAASAAAGQPIADPATVDPAFVRQLVADQREAAAQAAPKTRTSKTAPTPAASASTNSEG